MAASLPFSEIAKNVRHEIVEDRAFGRAAELAFYVVLSLFPLLICMLTMLTFFPGSKDVMIQYMSRFLPEEALGLIRGWVTELFETSSRAVFSFGLLFSLWSASTGMSALMDVLNTAYEVEERRSFLKKTITALLLTITLTLLVVIGVALVIYGRTLLGWLFSYLNLPLSAFWNVLTYLGGLGLLFVSLVLTYNFGPNIDRSANKVWPGALFAVAGILIVSFLFSLYLKFGPSYSATYGSLGAVVVLMLWLYFSGLVIMTGAEINSEFMKRTRRDKKAKAAS